MEHLLLPEPYQLEHLESVDSTNLYLKKQLLEKQVFDKHVVVADRQSAGRGRRGREWVSDIGNLYFSASHQIDPTSSNMNFYSLATGLAIRDVLAFYLPSEEVKWKWPNDVLVKGQKISGILLEQIACNQTYWLVTGVGINIESSPPAETTLWPSTSLSEHMQDAPDRFDVVKRFVKLLDSYYKRVSNGDGQQLIDICLAHAANLGQPIQVRLPDKMLEGKFEGLDHHGNLLLAHKDGVKTIGAADIFF